MNTRVEIIQHCTLADGDYHVLLQFCIDSAVNLMLSFPDFETGDDGEYIPFETEEVTEPYGCTERRLLFGSRTCGIEVLLKTDVVEAGSATLTGDTVIAETFGLNDRQSVMLKSVRYAGEPHFNRSIELQVTGPDEKSSVLVSVFRKTFEDLSPGGEKLDAIVRSAMGKTSRGLWERSAGDAGYVLRFRPGDTEAMMVLGIACGATGDWRGAKKWLYRVVEKVPVNYDAWYNLGLAYRSGSDNHSALLCFDKAAESDPENHAAYYMRGVVLRETGRDDEAAESFRYALKFSPNPEGAWHYSGIDFTDEAKRALDELGFPWRGDGAVPDPEGVDLNRDFMRAASEGDVRAMGKLLARGVSAEFRSGDREMHGRTPLIAAAVNGHLNAVRYLLDHGADVNSWDENGFGALGSAVEWGRSRDVIMFLIERGADVNGLDPYGRPIILNERVLGDTGILAALAGGGADISAVDEHGACGLLCAAASGSAGAVEFFLEHGADINSRNRVGETALMLASHGGDHEMISLLLERGADPDAPDREGRTPLMISAEYADAEAIKLLLCAGADVNKRDRMERSAMDILMDSGSRGDMDVFRRCVDLLADAGAELIHESAPGPDV